MNKIINILKEKKSIPLDQFINISLYDKKFGYYMKKNPFGKKGDFITSPLISNLFGEMITIWCVAFWEHLKKPSKILITELGPGDGTLCEDIINTSKNFKDFYKCLEINLLEKSDKLKKIQKKKIKEKKVKWINKIDEINGGPIIFLGNEFFDSFPIKQIYKKNRSTVTGVVNAAGIASLNLAVTTPPHITQKIIQTNLVGTIYCCQLLAPLMLRNKCGSIINFSTLAVVLGLKAESIYAASKAGVEAFSRSFAREMAYFNVRVNCISPGPIETDLLKGITSENIDRIVARQIIPKQFAPSDICDLVEILLNRKSSSLSGQVLNVGGA